MAELYNYIVAADVDAEPVRDALLAELTERRGWKTATPEAAGSRHLSVWRSNDGHTVVELDGSWDEADRELAAMISKRCATTAAAYYFTGAGELETLDLFATGRTVGAYSLSDAAGDWEMYKGKKRVFHHDWSASDDDSEAEYERVRGMFTSARRDLFDSGPLGALIREEAWSHLTPAEDQPRIDLSLLDPNPPSTLSAVEPRLQQWLEPLLSTLDFKRAKAEPRQLEAAVAYERPVGTGKLRVQYGFDKAKIFRIAQRIDFVHWDESCNCWISPHVDIGSRDVEQFQPSKGPEHLDRACRFLAASLAREWKSVAELVPELSAEIEQVSQTEIWRSAAGEYDELWRTRLVASQRAPGWQAARLVFKGTGLLVVETEQKERFTFKFETSMAPDSTEYAVGGIWETSSGTARARELLVGQSVLQFDEAGVLQSQAGGHNAPPTGGTSPPRKPWWKRW